MDEMTAQALRTAWRASQQGLFVIGGDVERYERALQLVRAVVDRLGGVATSEDLLEQWSGAGELVRVAAAEAGVALGGLPVQDVAGAAFALRYDEIGASEAGLARVALVRAAREAGETWVELQAAGDPGAGLASPYASTRMHVASGLAIVAGTQPEPETGRAVLTLAVVRLDAATGHLVDADPGIADRMFGDAESLRRGEGELAAEIERHANQSVG